MNQLLPSGHPEPGPWRARAAFALLGLALLLCGAAGLRLYQAQQRYLGLEDWRVHTHVVLRALDQTMTSIQEADSTQRGFLVTGEPVYLKYRADALQALGLRMDQLDALLKDHPAQQASLVELRRLVGERQAVEEKVILARPGGSAAMAAAIAEGRGRGRMTDITAVHQRMETEELRLLGLREAAVLQGRAAGVRAFEVLAGTAGLLVALGLGLMVRLGRERRRIEEAWRRNTAILDSATDFVSMMRPDGRILYWNPAKRRLLGLDPEGGAEELEGWNVRRSHMPESWHRLLEVGVPAAEAQGQWVGECEYRDKAGRPLPVSVVLIAHKDAQGRLVALSSIARDIRELKATENLKQDFIATVNHELRTPLTAIKGTLGLLMAGAGGGETGRGLLDIAQRNVERLERIVEDLLDLERLEEGRLELQREALELDPLLDQAAARAASLFQVRGLSLDRGARHAGLRVLGDRERLLQALSELLSNAAKFSPDAGAVRLRGLAAEAGRVRLEVENAGPEIPEALRGRLFRKFSQAGAPDGQRHGAGLGLSLVKAIAERMGGRVDCESATGCTVFRIELPAA